MKRILLFMAAATFATFDAPARAGGVNTLFEAPTAPAAETELDRLVFTKLAELGIQPVSCSDAVFVRRVFLDVIGTLPTAKEAREFIEDPAPDKRRALIDRLLEREEFADYWAMKWSDVLRIKAEFPINLWPNAAQAYHRWVHASLAANKPYDQFARELLTSSGSNFRVGPVNFYRAMQNRKPEGIATIVALTFMGTRAETWPSDRLAGMAAFFSQIGYKPTSEWKEEHVFWDPIGIGSAAPGRAAVADIAQPPASAATPAPASAAAPRPTTAMFPDGTKIDLPSNRDPREIFADWLINQKNPWFARALANRMWAWLLGRGIVHEPDDIREDNPPANPALLAHLEREFIAMRFDLKRLYRLILNSQVYQLSSLPHGASPAGAANFASYPLRRLDAEVLIDAINRITGTSDLYTSPIPEPFTYIPENQPAIAIADGSITSPFLALFGRSARATGLASERDNNPVPAQALHLLNSSHIQRKLEQSPNLKAIFDARRAPAQTVEDLYLTILSRPPTAAELRMAETAAAAPSAKQGVPARRREDWIDLAWALMNSTEFLYRH